MARAKGNAQKKGRVICIVEGSIEEKGGRGRKVDETRLGEPRVWSQIVCFESQLGIFKKIK